METHSRYPVFDVHQIKTYPISERLNKVTLANVLDPDEILTGTFSTDEKTERAISEVAGAVVSAREQGNPVLFFTGAHLIKNGLSKLLIDLVRRGSVTLVAGNGAVAIHDFELALIGETSEDVPEALEKGKFGMAHEFALHNASVLLGNRCKLGYGEALGKTICDGAFRGEVVDLIAGEKTSLQFRHPEVSVLAACHEHGVPFTVHVGIGMDVVDQHPSFNGETSGGASARDFLIFVHKVAKMTEGGVLLNVGSAVTGPEVFLKAVSMACNAGKTPNGIVTADFDLRTCRPEHASDESAEDYYYRDLKSIVVRIPRAFHGKGYYIQGNHKTTIPLLYKKILSETKKGNGG